MPPKQSKAAEASQAVAGLEGGQTRSGALYSKRNVPYYSSVKELLSHHKRLLSTEPAITTKYFTLSSKTGTLSQTTVRLRTDCENTSQVLKDVFLDLFRQTEFESRDAFEVVITFNAILTNREGNSFSVYFGHDYRAGNAFGASSRLRYDYGDEPSTFIVKSLSDVAHLPTSFNFEDLVARHRHSFDDSDVRVLRFLNIIYLIYQFKQGN